MTQFRCRVRKRVPFHASDLLLIGSKLLHAVHPDREDVHEAQMLGVLGKHGREIAVERHVVAHEHPITYGRGKPHGLVVGFRNANEIASVKSGFQGRARRHLHAVACNAYSSLTTEICRKLRFRLVPPTISQCGEVDGLRSCGRRDHLQFFSGDFQLPQCAKSWDCSLIPFSFQFRRPLRDPRSEAILKTRTSDLAMNLCGGVQLSSCGHLEYARQEH